MPQPITWELQAHDTSLTETLKRVTAVSDEMGTKGTAAFLKLDQAQATYQATMRRTDEQMAVYLSRQGNVIEGSKAWEAAELRLIGLESQQDTALLRLTSATEAYALAQQQAAEAADKLAAKERAKAAAQAESHGGLMQMLGSAAENVLVYGSLYSLYGKLTQGVSDFTKALFDNAAANEKFINFANASVGGGPQRLAEIQALASSAGGGGLPLKDLEALDQRLQLLGVTAENTQQRFGRSITQVRTDLVTLANVPGMDSSKALEFFSRADDGAQRLVASLLTAGLTSRAELESMGVKFKGVGSTITSDTKTNTEALLRMVEEKWGNLSEVNASTWDGVTNQVHNSWDRIAGILGRDVTGAAKKDLQDLNAALSDPKALAAADTWGTRLGDVFKAMDNTLKATIQQWNELDTLITTALAATQSAITGNTDYLKGVQGGKDLWQQLHEEVNGTGTATTAVTVETNAAKAQAQGLADAFKAADAAAAQIATQVADLQGRLQDARDASAQLADNEKAALAPIQAQVTAEKEAKAARDATFAGATDSLQTQLQGQQDLIKGWQQSESDANAAATAQVDGLRGRMQGLQDQSTALGEHYAALIQPWKDLEAAQNRAYENGQRATRAGDLQARIRLDTIMSKDLGSAEGRSAGQRLIGEKEQLGQLQGEIAHQSQIQGDQDHITALERAQKSQQDAIKDQEQGITRAIASVEATRKAADSYYQGLIRQEQTSVDATQDALKNVAAMRKAADALYDTQIKGDEARVKAIQDAVKAQQDGMIAVEHALDRQIHALQEQAKAGLVVTEQQSLTVLGTIAKVVANITGAVLTFQHAAAGIADSGGGYVPPAPGNPGGYAPGPAPKNAPDFGPGTPYAGPQGSAPTHLHVTVGFDDSLHPAVKKVVQGELRNPQNGSAVSAGLSWGGG